MVNHAFCTRHYTKTNAVTMAARAAHVTNAVTKTERESGRVGHYSFAHGFCALE